MNKLEECAASILSKVPLGYGMSKPEAREYARAVIRCLMEPNELMEIASARAYNECDLPWPTGNDYLRAMLQAVLDEAKE